MQTITRKSFWLFFLPFLSLSFPILATAQAQVDFTNSGFTINGVAQNSWQTSPADFENSNTLWNGNSTQHSGNTVTINFTTPPAGFGNPDMVVGGYNSMENVSGNQVFLYNGTILFNIYGGYSETGAANNNSVTIDGGTVDGTVNGGLSEHATSELSGNRVTINGGTLNGNIYGAQSEGQVKNNTVTITGGTIAMNVVGASSSFDVSTQNIVNIRGGTIAQNIYGGIGLTQAAANNVNINGGTINGDVYGGFSLNGASVNNQITISGQPIFGRNTVLFGGASSQNAADVRTGNTLNLQTAITVAQTRNFENYRFYLPTNLQAEQTMLTIIGLENPGANADTNIDNVNILIAVENTAPVLQAGDLIRLIKIETPDHHLVGTPQSTVVSQGLTRIYEIEVRQTDTSYDLQIVAHAVAPETSAISETNAAGLAHASQGTEMVANQGLAALLSAAQLDWSAPCDFFFFGAVRGGSSTYKTNAAVRVNGVSVLAGLGKCFSLDSGKLLVGAFVESGFGKHDQRNTFTSLAETNSTGNLSYLGGGLLGRLNFKPGFYVEASTRIGSHSLDFYNPDWQGQAVAYESSSFYFGAHLGLGYLFSLSETLGLDLYGKYLFTHLGKDTVRLNNVEQVELDAANSSQARVGIRLSHLPNQVGYYLGAAYEYQFAGQVNATTAGLSIAEAGLRGGSGIMELGLNWQPQASRSWLFELGVEASIGTRRGINGVFRINARF